jgi:hypothetical protein
VSRELRSWAGWNADMVILRIVARVMVYGYMFRRAASLCSTHLCSSLSNQSPLPQGLVSPEPVSPLNELIALCALRGALEAKIAACAVRVTL